MDPRRDRRLLAGLGVFLSGWATYCLLARYQDGKALPPGVDPLLSALPSVGGDWLLTWGWLLFNAAVIAYWAVARTPRLGYFLAMVGLWQAVRAVFIALTPFGPPPDIVPFYAGALSFLRGRVFFDSELFFSGHTGLPYLYALLAGAGAMYKGCLAVSVVMAAGVLLTRNHFPIDVLGAYFITYSTWSLGRKWLAALDPPA
ncbi:MAG: hypothetical protein HY553_10760 [Elusimicrobia bacterium]|nr:hypothetical protein [Elusimicrobiota bacterium]